MVKLADFLVRFEASEKVKNTSNSHRRSRQNKIEQNKKEKKEEKVEKSAAKKPLSLKEQEKE